MYESRGHDWDLRDPFGLDHDTNDVTFYWGIAAGGTHAALHRAYHNPVLPTPNATMLNYRTKMNGLWEGPDWFIDCGGSPQTIKANHGHPDDITDYLAYVADPPTMYGADSEHITIDKFALRDYPCEPAVRDTLDATVHDLQLHTLDAHIRMLDLLDTYQIDADPVAVLQGWEPNEYLECLDLFFDHGIVLDNIGIGTICERQSVSEIRELVERLRQAVPPRVNIHGFGVKKDALENPEALTVFDSVDSSAWEQRIRWATKDGIKEAPPGPDAEYADWEFRDDDGNPRYVWQHVQWCFAGYYQQIANLQRDSQTETTQVISLSDWGAIMDTLDADVLEDDGYPLLECLCGTLIDPGRPIPLPDPGCRHCERTALNIRNLHLDNREQRDRGAPLTEHTASSIESSAGHTD